MTCMQCHTENRANWKFGAACGQKLPSRAHHATFSTTLEIAFVAEGTLSPQEPQSTSSPDLCRPALDC